MIYTDVQVSHFLVDLLSSLLPMSIVELSISSFNSITFSLFQDSVVKCIYKYHLFSWWIDPLTL